MNKLYFIKTEILENKKELSVHKHYIGAIKNIANVEEFRSRTVKGFLRYVWNYIVKKK